MKIRSKLLLLFALLFCSTLFAQTDIAGTWQGKLTIDPTTKMTIHFILTKKADGSYSAVLNSPDSGGIKNVAANSVKYTGGKLSIDVTSLSGAFSGTLAKGTITGEWRQQGSTFPLVLVPYVKPSVSSLKPILGDWICKLKATETMVIPVIFHFETGKDGKFKATFDQPEQGGMGLEVTDVALEGDQVSFKIPIASGEYKGTLKNDSITGTYKVSGRDLVMNLNRGKYQPPPSQIDLNADAMKLLAGRWRGTLGPISIVFRFERDTAGKPVVLIDSPDQKAVGLPVLKAALTEGTLTLEIPNVAGKYVGKLTGDKLDGTWTQVGQSNPLVLTKEASAPKEKK
jgi:hypothetical protein